MRQGFVRDLAMASVRSLPPVSYSGYCFLNLGSEVQVLSGTPFSAQLSIYKHARE
jgi:hypothetical protein